MSELLQTRGAGFHMISEANGALSRDKITIDTGVLAVSTVLGKITATGKYVQVNLAAVDGSEVAAAVLFDKVDATAADVFAAAHTRLCEVSGAELVYPTGATQGNKDTINADLAAKYIIVR